MPLPVALLSRLAKRGIVDDKHFLSNEPEQPKGDVTNEQEEVIAEDYDESEAAVIKKSTNATQSDMKYKGHPGCPNKYNVWHECTTFCKEFWSNGHKRPGKRYYNLRKKTLAAYPLIGSWKEVYDPGTGRYYYWDEDKDRVTWLPPAHPRAVITNPASYNRKERILVHNKLTGKEQENSDSDSSSGSERRRRKYSSSDENSDDETNRQRHKRIEKLQVFNKSRGRKRVKENDIDPMDPAAYSDIPRGGWSDGLNKGLEAKTGVDTTASGPLYQMRPYPSPGAILRANASKSKGH